MFINKHLYIYTYVGIKVQKACTGVQSQTLDAGPVPINDMSSYGAALAVFSVKYAQTMLRSPFHCI